MLYARTIRLPVGRLPIRRLPVRRSGSGRLNRARTAVTAYFAVLGMAEGVWVTRIPAVKHRLHLSDGLLGLALLVGPAGFVLAMLVAGRLADRFGSARLARPAGIAVAFLPGALWASRTLTALLASLLAFGVTSGLLDVSINAQGVQVERRYRRPLMTSFHAAYSLGGLAGAVLGGLLAWAGLGTPVTFLATAVPLAAGAVTAGHWLLADSRPPGGRPGRPPGSAAADPGWDHVGHDPGRAAGAGDPGRDPGPAVRPAAGPARMLMLGALALCCLVGEGTAGNWSAVYLRDSLGVPGGLAAAGFAAFCIAMAAGRLVGDRLAVRFGPAGLMRGCGILAAIGLAAGLASDDPAGAIAGFALFGAGLSCTIPQLLSAAGNADPGRPGNGIARVASVGYIGLVGGPVLIGGCAALIGLPLALGIPVLLGLVVAACAGALVPAAARPASPEGRPAGAIPSRAALVSGTGPAPPGVSRSR